MYILFIVAVIVFYVFYRRTTLLKQVNLFNCLLYTEKNPEKYIEELNRLLRKIQTEKERSINLIQKTTGLFYVGRFDEAIKILTEDINKIPPNWQHVYYHNLILCLFLNGETEKGNEVLGESKEVLDIYAKKDYNKPAIELIYAVADYYNGKGTGRIEFFNDLTETGRNDYRIALGYYFLGKIYGNENDEDKSRLCLDKAGKLGAGSFIEEISLY